MIQFWVDLSFPAKFFSSLLPASLLRAYNQSYTTKPYITLSYDIPYILPCPTQPYYKPSHTIPYTTTLKQVRLTLYRSLLLLFKLYHIPNRTLPTILMPCFAIPYKTSHFPIHDLLLSCHARPYPTISHILPHTPTRTYASILITYITNTHIYPYP